MDAQQTYTQQDVSRAVNAGADTVMDALDLGERDRDVVNLVVNAALAELERPGVTFDAVIGANFAETPQQVREWWSGWE